MRRGLSAVIVVLLWAGIAQAGSIAITSSNGTTNWEALVSLTNGSFTAGVGATGTAVSITPHSAWAPGGGWISYAKTGISPDNILAPTYNQPITDPDPEDQRQAIALFTRSFTGGVGDVLTMKLWADDTAFMRVDGGEWIPTTHTWAQSTCETNPTSCSASLYSLGTFTLGSAGEHTLEIRAYQIGTGTTNDSNPFGIKYEGELTSVPDPASTLLLFGISLLGLGALRKWRG